MEFQNYHQGYDFLCFRRDTKCCFGYKKRATAFFGKKTAAGKLGRLTKRTKNIKLY